MLTVLINEHFHDCFALRGNQLFYYSDGGYRMSAVPSTDDTPRVDYLGEELNICSKAIVICKAIVLWLLMYN